MAWTALYVPNSLDRGSLNQVVWLAVALGICYGIGNGVYISVDYALACECLPDSGSDGAKVGTRAKKKDRERGRERERPVRTIALPIAPAAEDLCLPDSGSDGATGVPRS